jgi:HIRAN domain-containing protein
MIGLDRAPQTYPLHLPSSLTRPLGYTLIRLPIAGVMHHRRARSVRRLVLGQVVHLRHDPKNEFDVNAISVETIDGSQLGYIGRGASARLGQYAQTRSTPIEAVVTELTSDMFAEAVGAGISFYVPDTLAADILVTAHEWEYCCDATSDGITYLMLTCDEAELARVNGALRDSGFRWARSGLAYGPASDGRQYRWYVRLEGAPEAAVIDRVLNDTLGGNRRAIDTGRWIAEFDAESTHLRAENGALRDASITLKARIRELEHALANPSLGQRRESRRDELADVLDILIPGVVLIRNSLDVIQRELENREPALRELRRLCWEPVAMIAHAKQIQRAPEWREIRFRATQGDDGRLYFRKRDQTWHVLVSFKEDQRRDLEYLQHH